MKRLGLILLCVLIAAPAQAGWNPLKKDEQAADRKSRHTEVMAAIQAFKEKDPSMRVFFDKAYGYAVFPTVGKGGIGIGAAYGKGEVLRQGEVIGTSSLKQLTIGLQLGGQAYSEIVFFKDKAALDRFRAGNYEFSAQASAIAATDGASADAGYNDGVAIFTLGKGGLMFEASVGGQKFTYQGR
jgi:lipid-binding SYLF domain-containing protein